jgi:hypothetical protein
MVRVTFWQDDVTGTSDFLKRGATCGQDGKRSMLLVLRHHANWSRSRLVSSVVPTSAFNFKPRSRKPMMNPTVPCCGSRQVKFPGQGLKPSYSCIQPSLAPKRSTAKRGVASRHLFGSDRFTTTRRGRVSRNKLMNLTLESLSERNCHNRTERLLLHPSLGIGKRGRNPTVSCMWEQRWRRTHRKRNQ